MNLRRLLTGALPCAALFLLGSLAGLQADDDNWGQSDSQPIKVAKGVHPQRMSEWESAKAFNTASSGAGGGAHNTPSGGSVASALPTYAYSVKSSRDNKTYTGQIVGQNPATGGTTYVTVVVIPVILTFKYSSTTSYAFDPTAADTGCLGSGNTAMGLTVASPVFQSYGFTLKTSGDDNTTYPDHFNRANFYSSVVNNPNSYHTLFNVMTEPAQNVTLSASSGFAANASVYAFSGQCGSNTGNTNLPGYLGVVNINTWDPIAQSLIKSLNLNSSQFPVFVFYNAAMSQGRSSTLNNCCILGYHNALSNGQTYGVADFEGRNQTLFGGTSDVSILSHEVNEWMQDPFGNNLTPAWGGVGQVPTNNCQNDYEVGDPLSGTLLTGPITAGSFTYHLQELAFFSWFYGGTGTGGTSLGVNGWFSDNGTFKIPAAKCPPGGV